MYADKFLQLALDCRHATKMSNIRVLCVRNFNLLIKNVFGCKSLGLQQRASRLRAAGIFARAIDELRIFDHR